jgi:FKBP-type peptidyl-prolyl cis-trans isomerase FklB
MMMFNRHMQNTVRRDTRHAVWLGERRWPRAIAWVALTSMGLAGPAISDDETAQPETGPDEAAYSAGHDFGQQLVDLQSQGKELALEAVLRGMLDALAGAEPRLGASEMAAALEAIQADAGGVAGQAPPARARHGGFVDDFAVLNARKPGVVSLPSGVQYEVLQPGSGPKPQPGQAVLLYYEGTLTNGVVFDSADREDPPLRMELDGIVVPGLKEALLLMPQGARWRVVIPPSMGFGRSGKNMLRRRDLIYDIELVDIEAAD